MQNTWNAGIVKLYEELKSNTIEIKMEKKTEKKGLQFEFNEFESGLKFKPRLKIFKFGVCSRNFKIPSIC